MRLFCLLLFLLFPLSCERERNAQTLQIGWYRDYSSALDEAANTGKPVFLYFSAVWCSWCREYEKELVKLSLHISKNFVPLLLDSDRDRELFLKFGGRGTPFTVVMDSRGKVLLRFHGSVKAEDLKEVLYVALKGEVYSEEGGEGYKILEVDRETYHFLMNFYLRDLKSRYDSLYGGFSSPSERGSLFKWSTPLTYDFLLERSLLREEVLFSLKKDVEFLYDPVDGGFFNFYDRTRAFSFYFETSKSLVVNALMIQALLEAYRTTGDRFFLYKALGTYSYLTTYLFHPESGCFLNAQVSAPEYYNLKPEERRKRKPPATDTAIIVEDNAKAILALLELHRELKSREPIDTALRCADYLLRNLLSKEGLYRYYDVEKGSRGLPNFGRDIAWLGLALLELSKVKPEYRSALEEVLGLKPSYEDWVSTTMRAYILSEVWKKEARRLLTGVEIDLSYQNPDDITFLLRALENLIERNKI